MNLKTKKSFYFFYIKTVDELSPNMNQSKKQTRREVSLDDIRPRSSSMLDDQQATTINFLSTRRNVTKYFKSF